MLSIGSPASGAKGHIYKFFAESFSFCRVCGLLKLISQFHKSNPAILVSSNAVFDQVNDDAISGDTPLACNCFDLAI